MRTRLRLAAAASVMAVSLLASGCTAPSSGLPDAAAASVADELAAADAADAATEAELAEEAAERLAAEERTIHGELTARESAAAAVLDDVWWWLDSPPSADAALTVTGARTELLDGVDRLVLDLAGTGEPGWGVEVVETASDDGSGFPVEVEGDQFVLLRLAGMEFPVDAEHAQIEPQLLDVDGAALAQVAVRFWSEGNLNVFLGVVGDGEPQVTAELHHDPLRLVVDVAHP
ncbi:hypothetical protein Xcel_3256 [Xylanimonas cellulosilytica DSM 15894]|uniref:AMIN-like domain-containing protein n=1 Tax=Xylanimonas cellulosilytica (strain DSM 15894 / JCM 12276 / CECT 5975 / KCTC 9989 / LMG 20990 / NBRC 107835 / XIL07) TaxID=446471 RepID=D1C0Q3_XYLCX|nr:hypothetical protein [Xylanimonas cellulosilytica]ACZ32256.1 hypothetical protein Xcel_3256 [Xylanimonas cellulosilytica DSM 15894]